MVRSRFLSGVSNHAGGGEYFCEASPLRYNPRHVSHLAPGARLALAIEVQAGPVLLQHFLPTQRVITDQIVHHNRAMPPR